MKNTVVLLFLFFPLIIRAQTAIITTVAGGGTGGNGGPVVSALIDAPGGIVFDHSGNYYFCEDDETIRKVDTNGILSTIAGTGIAGFNGDGGPATDAEINRPYFITVNMHGDLYFADGLNYRVRKIDGITGIITTVAGNGVAGYSGDGGPADSAELNLPFGVCLDRSGNLYISDQLNYRIREVDTNGIIYTFAGTGTFGISGNGGLADTTEVGLIEGICSDRSGNVYFTDGNTVRKISSNTNLISTVAGSGVTGIAGDDGPADSAQFGDIIAIVVDSINNLYIADVYGQNVRKVDTAGIVHAVAGTGVAGFSGDGGVDTAAELHDPEGVATDACGNLYICDLSNNRIRKVTFDSTCGSNNDTTNAVQNIKAGGFSVYPNPANLTLTLSINGEGTTVGEGINSVVVYNMLGQVVYNKVFVQQKKITIDISALPDGVYFVKVNGVSVEKVVKE